MIESLKNPHHENLRSVLAKGYFSRVDAVSDFARHATDKNFRAVAQAEYDRLKGLENSLGCPLAMRDHAAAQHLAFLKTVLGGK